MNSILLKLIGVPADEISSVSGISVQLSPVVSPILIAITALILGIFSWSFYKSTPEDVKKSRGRGMLIMRILFFILLLGILLKPIISLDLERDHKKTLAVLIDSSSSMGIADPRINIKDIAREAIANGTLDPSANLDSSPDTLPQSPSSRFKIAEQALNNDKINLLKRLGEKSEIVTYNFGGAINDSSSSSEPKDTETSIGNALHEVLRRHSADDLGGILLISDGANNEGKAIVPVAEDLRERGIPVFAYAVGTDSPRDTAIKSIELPSVALAEDAVPVTIQFNQQGMAGEKGKLIISMSGAKAIEKEFVFSDEENQEITVPIIPKKSGEYQISATIETSIGEILDNNNSFSRGLRVLDSSLKVLMIESSPRWEFKYVQAMLLRERRIDLDCFLAGADPIVARTENSPYLESFPDTREQLFDYDLIMFGDINPDQIPENTIENISSFVSNGGGSLIIMAGKRFTPSSYRNTELQNLIPVELAPTRLGGNSNNAQRPILLDITEAGLNEGFLNLEEDPDLAKQRWSKLPPIFWSVKTLGAKPAAKTYLTHPDGDYPIVSIQKYGAGEVLWIGTENTWRWRKNTGDLYHTRFWGQIVQRMAGRRLATGSRRSELRSDRAIAKEGENFTVFARLLDENFLPREDETIEATLVKSNSNTAYSKKVTLRAVPGSPGYYRSEFSAEDQGRYRLTIIDDESSGIDLNVRGADREFSKTAIDEKTLKEIADITNGSYLREENLNDLPTIAKIEPAKIKISREATLWSSPLYLILLLLPITIEWFMRKFAELK